MIGASHERTIIASSLRFRSADIDTLSSFVSNHAPCLMPASSITDEPCWKVAAVLKKYQCLSCVAATSLDQELSSPQMKSVNP